MPNCSKNTEQTISENGVASTIVNKVPNPLAMNLYMLGYDRSKNLVRLNKGDRIKIIKPKHLEEIYEVELLDGFEKNKKYYVIKEDLFLDFSLMEI